jgi:metal-responsive CopG/Arc/MetJ family transcriptional regulator
MREVIAISLPQGLKSKLDRFVKKNSMNRSDFVRDAIEKQMIIGEFERIRKKMIPKAQAMGIYTDEDVFTLVS